MVLVDHFQTIGRLPSIRHMYNKLVFWSMNEAESGRRKSGQFSFGMFLSKVILEQDCLVQFKVKENTTNTTAASFIRSVCMCVCERDRMRKEISPTKFQSRWDVL